MSIGEEVDKLDFKQKECIGELVKLFQIMEEKRSRTGISSQSYRFLSKLE